MLPDPITLQLPRERKRYLRHVDASRRGAPAGCGNSLCCAGGVLPSLEMGGYLGRSHDV
jgi:hypothetical protein